MSGTFDDWAYGQEPEAVVPETVVAPVSDPLESLLLPEPPNYETVKAAKKAQGAAVTPEELAVVAEHKRARREREAEEEAAQARRQAAVQVLNESPPEEAHKWTLVSLMLAEQATDEKEMIEHYADAQAYLNIVRQQYARRSREARRKARETA